MRLQMLLMLLIIEFLFGIALIFVGFAVETLGWRLHQQIVGISGFIVGLVIGDFIGSQVLSLDFFVWKLAILVVSSVAFSILFFVYMRISIAVTSGIVGALIVSGFTSSRTLVEWSLDYSIFQTNFNFPALIIAFAVSTYVGYRFYKLGYIILSTGLGSILVAYGGIISGFWTYSYLGIFLLLSLLLGVIVQLSHEGIIRGRRLQIQEFRYCTKCGNLLSKNSDVCPKCGYFISTEEK
jgi:hypothetical protein